MTTEDPYSLRGVSSGKEDVRRAVATLDAGLYPDAFCRVLPDADADFAYLLHADTAGTKSVLAYLYWRETGDLAAWDGIAQDALVMNLDDMACAGATDGFVAASTISRNKHLIPADVLTRLIQAGPAFLASLEAHGVRAALAGGETADVGDVVRTVDVGFTVSARLLRSRVVRNRFRPGDVIVGLASDGQATYEAAPNSGIGCNGLTSARHDLLRRDYARYTETFDPLTPDALVYRGPYGLTDTPPDALMTVGQMLLSPTRTYLPILKPLLERYFDRIHGLVHCTGGGQTKCLHFAKDVHIIKDNLFQPPQVFRLIQEASGTDWALMYRTYNMGCRLEIYTDAETAPQLIELAESFNVRAQVIGRVEAAPTPHLTLDTGQGVFAYAG